VLLIVSTSSLADGPVYGELQVGVGGVYHSDLNFYPRFATASLGAYVLPNIGLELFADTGFAPGDDEDFELDIEQAYGIALRFQSPPWQGLSGFIVAGAVNYTLDQSLDSADSPSVNEEFTGARVSVGIMQRLKRLPGLLLTVEYRHYNADEPLKVDALVLGWRVNAP